MLVLLSVLSVSLSRAAVLYAASSGSLPHENVSTTCTSDDPCSLALALLLAGAGDTLALASGEYSGGSSCGLYTSQAISITRDGTSENATIICPDGFITATAPLNITGPLTLSGAGNATLEAPLLSLQGSVVHGISHVELYHASYGAIALHNESVLYLDSATLRWNRGAAGAGLALDRDSQLIFSDGIVEFNRAEGPGGVINAASQSSVTLSNLSAWHNRADRGGVLYAGPQASVIVVGGTMAHNTGVMGGGVFSAYGSRLNVSGSVFFNNLADSKGGVIWGEYPGTVITVEQCDFHSNLGAQRAGVLMVGFNGAGLVRNSNFTQNKAVSGGVAVVEDGGNVRFEHSVMWNNSATHSGGACVVAARSSVTLANCTLYDNIAAAGAALSCGDANAVIVDGTTLDDDGIECDTPGLAAVCKIESDNEAYDGFCGSIGEPGATPFEEMAGFWLVFIILSSVLCYGLFLYYRYRRAREEQRQVHATQGQMNDLFGSSELGPSNNYSIMEDGAGDDDDDGKDDDELVR